MEVVKFKGTSEEFKDVAYLFSEKAAPEGKDEIESAPTIEPVEGIRKMLTRRTISNGQKAVYKALANGRLEYSDFLKQTKRTAQQMAGVLGALGRRINNTQEIHQAGLPGNTKAVLKWEKEGGIEYVSLKPYVHEALVAEGVI